MIFHFVGAVFCLTWVCFGRLISMFLIRLLPIPSLYGTTLAQTVFYLRSFPDDSRERKSLVSVILHLSERVWTWSLGLLPLVPYLHLGASASDKFHYQCSGYLPYLFGHPRILVYPYIRAVRWYLFIVNDTMVGNHVLLSCVHWPPSVTRQLMVILALFVSYVQLKFEEWQGTFIVAVSRSILHTGDPTDRC